MTNKNYQRGAQFERRIRTYLEELGWTVFRMAGSKTKVDLIAFPPHQNYFGFNGPHFIQCKLKGAFGSAEREQFLKIVRQCDVVGLLACAPSRKIELYWAGDSKRFDQPFRFDSGRIAA